jgi:hypothetical protein
MQVQPGERFYLYLFSLSEEIIGTITLLVLIKIKESMSIRLDKVMCKN